MPSLMPFALLSLFVLTLSAASAWSATITTEDGVGADTYVRWREDLPESDTNYGAATTLRTKDPDVLNSSGYGNARKIYLRFDLTAIDAREVVAAALELSFAAAEPTGTNSRLWLFGLEDGHPGEGWGETAITWNNAPGNAQNCCSTSAEAAYLAEAIRPDDAEALDILSFASPELVDFLNADSDGRVTFIITGAGGGNDEGIFNAFHSKESGGVDALPPTLELTVVPEPSTALLLSLGLMSLSSMRERATPDRRARRSRGGA